MNNTTNITLRKLTFLLLMLLLLSACSGGSEERKYRIGVSQCSSGHWRDKLNSEMQRELLLHKNITMEIVWADDDDQKQIQQIQSFIDKRMDLIIVSPNHEEPLTEVVAKAYDSGIPVVLFDRCVKGDRYAAFVGGDNVGVGQQLAQFALKNLPHGGKVVELMGNMSSSPARQRHQGFLSDLQGYPKIEIVASVDALWNGPVAADMIDSLYQLHPDIDVVVAHSDWMASTAQQRLNTIAPNNKIRFIGADGFGSPGLGIYAVEDGSIDATAVYPTGGDIIMQTAIAILNGEKFNHETLIPSYTVSNPKEAKLLVTMYKELEHEVSTILRLRDQLLFLDHQHNLEQTLLLLLVGLLVLAICLVVTFFSMYRIKHRTAVKLGQQQDELRKQRDQLLNMTRELEDATNAKLIFFTNVSHEFRTPLTLISAPIESALRKISDESVQHMLHIAHRNVQILLGLVNQILDFRKAENGKMELQMHSIDLHPLFLQWYESFRNMASQKDIKMTLQIEDADWTIVCDHKKIERIIYNVVGNSLKFTSSGGTISIVCHLSGQSMIISVKDDGVGISKDNLQHIFERFYQIENTHAEGTGIGLALVKMLVELMHGHIDVESNADADMGPTGTTITIMLPVNQSETSLQESQPATENSLIVVREQSQEQIIEDDETRQVVLVIDDNADIREYLYSLLRNQYRVLTALNGKEGIEKARTAVPDIILCDVMMPVMDGLECCRLLKTDLATSHIPVLMLTACSLDEQRVKGLALGAEAYLSKPFSSAVLIAQIESLLKNRIIVRDFYGSTSEVKSVIEPAGEKKKIRKDVQLSINDQEFVAKLRMVIDKELADENFNVEVLSTKMFLSHAQLYRKTKALTGETPVELIRNSRLRKAKKMLDESNFPIATIAKSVGIPDASYFTKCYKNYFGVLPSLE